MEILDFEFEVVRRNILNRNGWRKKLLVNLASNWKRNPFQMVVTEPLSVMNALKEIQKEFWGISFTSGQKDLLPLEKFIWWIHYSYDTIRWRIHWNTSACESVFSNTTYLYNFSGHFIQKILPKIWDVPLYIVVLQELIERLSKFLNAIMRTNNYWMYISTQLFILSMQ